MEAQFCRRQAAVAARLRADLDAIDDGAGTQPSLGESLSRNVDALVLAAIVFAGAFTLASLGIAGFRSAPLVATAVADFTP